MDRGAWQAAVHGVAEGQTQLSNFTFTFHFHALEKEMWNAPDLSLRNLASLVYLINYFSSDKTGINI